MHVSSWTYLVQLDAADEAQPPHFLHVRVASQLAAQPFPQPLTLGSHARQEGCQAHTHKDSSRILRLI